VTRQLGELLGERVACPVRFACVYVVRDGGRVLYIGSTGRGVKHRMKQHLSGGIRFDKYLRECGEVALGWTVDAYPMASLQLARLVERYAIRALRPVWNDDGVEKTAA
jgi:predicted GIY-YIG superfamily endonuclease